VVVWWWWCGGGVVVVWWWCGGGGCFCFSLVDQQSGNHGATVQRLLCDPSVVLVVRTCCGMGLVV
jgi:hypothetical protein